MPFLNFNNKTTESYRKIGIQYSILTIISLISLFGINFASTNFGILGIAASIGLFVAVILSLLHPFTSFAIYFAVLFVQDANLTGLNISLNQMVAPLFFLSTAVWWIRNRTHNIVSPILFLLCIFSTYFAINAALGEHFESGILHSRYVVIYTLMAISIAMVLSSSKSIMSFAWIMFIITSLSACYGITEAFQKNIIGNFTGHWGNSIRIKGTAKTPIAYGWQMVFALPFGFFLFAELKSFFWRSFCIPIFLLIVLASFLTFNRQTLLLIGILTVASACFFTYKNKKTLVTGLGVLACIVSAPIAPLILQRLLTFSNLQRDYSLLERRDSILLTETMFYKHPIFGIGLGSFPVVWKNYVPADYETFFVQYWPANQPKYPDFTYVQLLAETGIIGLFLYIILLIYLLRRSWKFRKLALKTQDIFAANYATLVFILLIFVTLSSFIQDVFLYPRTWMIFGLALLLDKKIFGLQPSCDTSFSTTNEISEEIV